MQETPISLNSRREQFASTRMWKDLLRKFSSQVPAQNHKRQLRNYPETFTGKEALDCMEALLPKIFTKNCTRDTARKVLENYLDSKYILNTRDENNKQFSENATLYRLCNDRVNNFLGDSHSPIKVQNINRTSSVRKNNNQSLLQQQNHSQFSNLKTHNSFNSSELRRQHRRLSVSCQDISIKESPPHSPQNKVSVQNNLSGLIAGSISKASASIFSLHRSSSQNATNNRNKKANPKFLSDSVFKENDMNNIVPISFNANNNMYRMKTSKSVFRTTTVNSSQAEPIRKPQKPQITSNSFRQFKHTSYLKEDDTPISTSFCDRIDKSTYEQQSRTVEPHLHTLLDMILSNENLAPAEKFEKLKAFRVSYPTIYAQKFSTNADPLVMNEHGEPGCNAQNNTGTSFFRHLQNMFS